MLNKGGRDLPKWPFLYMSMHSIVDRSKHQHVEMPLFFCCCCLEMHMYMCQTVINVSYLASLMHVEKITEMVLIAIVCCWMLLRSICE